MHPRPAFKRYREGYRFAKLACDLVEKHGFVAYQAKVQYAMGIVSAWTRPIASRDRLSTGGHSQRDRDRGSRLCFLQHARTVNDLLVRNDPLDAVWRESEQALDFIRRAKYRENADMIVSQQRFISTMQGRTATFSTFSDAQFDEAAFEAELSAERVFPHDDLLVLDLKLKARFLSGDYAEALAAADKAKARLWWQSAGSQLLDYFYYTALTVAACYENASADEQQEWRELLTAHREQLREWADNNPPTFGDKHTLVLAEIARIEGRDADAMRLYEHAIRSASENGFVQNEGLAYEVAARFYMERGFETIANAYLRNARYCYLRWGADGKVKQLDRLHPQLAAPEGHRPRRPLAPRSSSSM